MHIHSPPKVHDDLEFNAGRALLAADSVGISRALLLSNAYSVSSTKAYTVKENDFVIGKLKNFLINIRKEATLKNNQVAIPGWKWKVLMGTDDQKAESLKKQWVEKSRQPWTKTFFFFL
jgi:hypothetical protein